jgi:hypothetical protein
MLTPTKFTYTFVSNEVCNFEKKARDANNVVASLFGWLFITKNLYTKFLSAKIKYCLIFSVAII